MPAVSETIGGEKVATIAFADPLSAAENRATCEPIAPLIALTKLLSSVAMLPLSCA